MVPPLNKEVASRVSSEVAETVAKDFYRAMGFSAQRKLLTAYFVAETDMGAGHKIPDIVYNGTKYDGTDGFQVFIESLPQLNYKVESLTAAIINPALAIEGFSEQDMKKGRAAVITVTATGYVGADNDDQRLFSDNFIMMPNPATNKNGRRDRGQKEWLISGYNSRLVG